MILKRCRSTEINTNIMFTLTNKGFESIIIIGTFVTFWSINRNGFVIDFIGPILAF